MKKIKLSLLLLLLFAIVGCNKPQEEKYKVLFLNKDDKVINTIFVFIREGYRKKEVESREKNTKKFQSHSSCH